jgi:uncharacterized protein YqjF (DUF2071 family)
MPRPFLDAHWENLILLNYACPPELLEPLVPAGTELDQWNGHTLISLVGFLFRDTRILGIAIPFHRTFAEVNLRFYVRRERLDGNTVRAVVFIRELVPRLAIATVARAVYNEPYRTVPMAHSFELHPDVGGNAEYTWRYGGVEFSMRATARGAASAFVCGSEAEFITEHYWGYTRQRDGGTLEYQVEHPPWHVWQDVDADFSGRADELYGTDFGSILAGRPRSSFLAVGSPVLVRRGERIRTARSH